MKLLLTITLYLAIFQISFCARSKSSNKRDSVFKSVFRWIIRDNKLTGFLVLDQLANYKKISNSLAQAKSKKLLREVSSQTTVVQIRFPIVKNPRKFLMNLTRIDSNLSSSAFVESHLKARDRVHLMILTNSHALVKQRKNLCHNIRYAMDSWTLIAGVSKTLLVKFLEKPFRDYRRLLKSFSFPNHYLYNSNVLEVVVSHKRFRARNKFRVMQYDFFKNTLRATKYLDKVKFFCCFDEKLAQNKTKHFWVNR